MRLAGIILTFLLLIGFYYSGSAIISVKFLELRIGLQRDRILNLELSSRALQRKSASLLLSNQKTVSDELNEIVLESNFLNSDEADTTGPGLKHKIALSIMNAVRYITWKDPINLSGDREVMVMLRYGYLLERKRKYEEAAKVYQVLQTKSSDADIEGFTLLHLGYCLFASGSTESAREPLILLEKKYPATHYAQAGAVLLNLLNQQLMKKEAIEQKFSGNRLLYARNAAKSGLCSESLKIYGKSQNLSAEDSLLLGNCLEKTGQSKRARGVYRELAESNDPEVARKANRRILMISTFYDPSEKEKQNAEKRAELLGDTETVKLVETAKQKESKPIVIEEIQELQNEKSELVEEVSIEQPEDLVITESEKTEEPIEEPDPRPVQTVQPVVVQPQIPSPIDMAPYKISRPQFQNIYGTLSVGSETFPVLVQTSPGKFLTGEDSIEIEEQTRILSSTGMLEIRLRGQKRAIYSKELTLFPEQNTFQIATGKTYPLALLYKINGI